MVWQALAQLWQFVSSLLGACQKRLPFLGAGAGAAGAADAQEGILPKEGLDVIVHGLSSKPELNGRKATLPAGPNKSGRWEVKIPEEGGEPKVLALKVANLLWLGRRVQLGRDACPDFAGCHGFVDSFPDTSGKCGIDARKILNLKPPNLESLPADSAIQKGSRVILRELQNSACYNGLEGVVQASAQNEQGRWVVEVSKLVAAQVSSLQFVWASVIFGEKLLTKAGEKPTEEVLRGKRAVLVYFSAHWCPPCRGFTPELADLYKKHTAGDVEMVFVSSDKDQATFESYYGEMPWVALPFADRSRQQALSAKFGVQGIPTLVALRGCDGSIASANARAEVGGMGGLSKCLMAWGC